MPKSLITNTRNTPEKSWFDAGAFWGQFEVVENR